MIASSISQWLAVNKNAYTCAGKPCFLSQSDLRSQISLLCIPHPGSLESLPENRLPRELSYAWDFTGHHWNGVVHSSTFHCPEVSPRPHTRDARKQFICSLNVRENEFDQHPTNHYYDFHNIRRISTWRNGNIQIWMQPRIHFCLSASQ